MGPSLSHRSQALALPLPPAHLRPAKPASLSRLGTLAPAGFLPPSLSSPEAVKCVWGSGGGFRDSCPTGEMGGGNQPCEVP